MTTTLSHSRWKKAAVALLLALYGAALGALGSHLEPPLEPPAAVNAGSMPPEIAALPPAHALPAMVGDANGWQALSGRERWRLYLRETFANPFLVPRMAFPALARHLDNDPQEWGQGGAAYATRLADRYGRFFVRQGIESAGAAALGHEVRYVRSRRSSIGSRVAHAVAMTFVTRDRTGAWTPHWSRFGAIVTAEYVGNAWMPPSYRTPAEAWRGIGIQFGIVASFNVAREFLPSLRASSPNNK